jgi:predicted Zn-dependent peptidase
VIRRSRLDAGLRVVTESLPHLRSVTIGAWVGTGARDEPDPQAGASHFLEHLLFKGTPSRSARQVADEIESVGGEFNAFTTHEQTVFYVRVPDSRVERAVDVLCDVLWHPAFRADEVDTEREVILEEIAMRDDTPDDLVHDVFAAAMFPEHPLGREVLGTRTSIATMPRDTIAAFHREHYVPTNTVLAAAGNLDHDALLELLSARVDGGEHRAGPPVRPARAEATFAGSEASRHVERDTEQAHMVLGVRGIGVCDPDRYALTVLNQVLGGGMSSRLFQEVREERGLAYSVYSYRGAFADTGFLALYAGTTSDRAGETLSLLHEQLDRLVGEGGVTDDELGAAKGALTGSLLMALETSAARMRRLGRDELVEGEILELDEIVARIEAVDAGAIGRVVERLLAGAPRTLAVVGPEPLAPPPEL